MTEFILSRPWKQISHDIMTTKGKRSRDSRGALKHAMWVKQDVALCPERNDHMQQPHKSIVRKMCSESLILKKKAIEWRCRTMTGHVFVKLHNWWFMQWIWSSSALLLQRETYFIHLLFVSPVRDVQTAGLMQLWWHNERVVSMVQHCLQPLRSPQETCSVYCLKLSTRKS